MDREPLECGCTPWTRVRCDKAKFLWQQSLQRHKVWRLRQATYEASGFRDEDARRLNYAAEQAASQAWLDYQDHLHPDDDHAGEPVPMRRDLALDHGGFLRAVSNEEGWDDESGTTRVERDMLEGTPFEVRI